MDETQQVLHLEQLGQKIPASQGKLNSKIYSSDYLIRTVLHPGMFVVLAFMHIIALYKCIPVD